MGKRFTIFKKQILARILLKKMKQKAPSKEDYDKLVDSLYEKNRNADKDCFTVDEKLKKGLNIEKIALNKENAWLIFKDKNPQDKIIYYIHGGGFTSGNTKERFEFISYAVNNFGYNFFSIDYRLAPEYKCVDTIEDLTDGYKYLLEKYNPKNICLMGEGAGGNLVFALTLKCKELNLPLPRGIVSCSPLSQFEYHSYSFFTASFKTDFVIGKGIVDMIYPLYKGDLDYKSPYMSPLYGDLSNFPDTYIDASREESLRDDARMLYAKLKQFKNNVEYHEFKYFEHAQLICPKFTHVRREEYPLIIDFLNKIFGKI